MEAGAKPTSPTGIRRGFTTIELMVALVIIAIMSMVVVVSMGPALEDARLRSGCRIVASALNYTRSYAVSRQTYARVVVDKEKNGVSTEALVREESGDETLKPVLTPSGRYHQLPRGVKIAGVRKPGIDVEEDYVGFSQMGQADDTVIAIVDARDKERYIVIDSITGRASIKSDEK